MNHLGGHYGHTAMPISTFDYLIDTFNIKSAVDIGCGPGGMTLYGNHKGVYVQGVDGDTSVEKQDYIFFHDFTTGPVPIEDNYDLAWSCEFLEHVESQYIPNFMKIFQQAQYVFCTAAPPGQGGHHHVNEQLLDYWYDVFDQYGFDHDFDTMQEIKKTSGDKMIVQNGMFFRNRNAVNPVRKEPYDVSHLYEYLKSEVNRHYDICGEQVVGYKRWE